MFGWYRYCLRHYATFSGRASRAEFWSFTLLNFLISIILLCFVDSSTDEDTHALLACLTTLFWLVILIPSWAVTVRRLHDRDHSGLWFFAQFIPFIDLVVILFLLLGSLPSPNQYGSRAPRYPTDEIGQIPPTDTENDEEPDFYKEPKTQEQLEKEHAIVEDRSWKKVFSPQPSYYGKQTNTNTKYGKQ